MARENSNESLVDDKQLMVIHVDLIVSRLNFLSMLIGLSSNFLCLLVFCNRQLLAKKFYYFLLAHIVIDFLFCAIVLINYAIYIFDSPHLIYDMSYLTCFYVDFIVESLDIFTVLMALMISIERLIAVAMPLKLREFVTHRYPKQIIATCALVIFAIKSPELFISFREYSYDPERSVFLCSPDISLIHSNALYMIFFRAYKIVLPVVLRILPEVLILILSILLCMSVFSFQNINRK